MNWKKFLFSSPASCANLFISLHLFLFLPALLFMASRRFWNYDFDSLLAVLLPLFVIAYVLLSLPIIWIKRDWYKHYAALVTGLAFAIWSCVFFLGSKGADDGKTFLLVTGAMYFYVNLFIVVFVGIIFGWLGFHKPKITNSILMLASIAFSVLVSGITFVEHKKPFLDYSQSQKELTSFSKQKNVLVILLDAFQSDFFQDILRNNPNWAKEFSGFTNYINAASTAPGTLLSLPTIHSGRVYKPEEELFEFYKTNIREQSFVKNLQEAGYSAMILNPYLGYSPAKVARVNQNYLVCPRLGVLCEAQQLLSYSLFNSVPHLFKKYIYSEGNWLLSQFFPSSKIVSNHILAALAANINSDSSVPTVKFLHLYGSHPPAVLDQSCQATTGLTWDRTAAINQAQCAMGNVIKVLQALKQANIYDQTAVFIIADHGAGLPIDAHESNLGASANPLFLFKSFNQVTELNYSKDPISLMDVKKMVCEASHDCFPNSQPAKQLTTILQHRQSLPFINYTLDKKQNLVQVTPYKIYGSPREIDSWVKVLPRRLAFISDFFQNYAGKGWATLSPKVTYRWAVGKEAELFLPLKPNQDASIVFTASTHRMNPHQEISVWANDTFIGKFPIAVETYSRVAFNIPKAIISKKPVHISFKFSESNLYPGQLDQTPNAVAFNGFLYSSG